MFVIRERLYAHPVCMPIVAYFIAVCCKEILVSVPRKWQENNVETCMGCTHK